MKVLNFVEFLKHTHFISILLLPALLVTGPFLPDLVCYGDEFDNVQKVKTIHFISQLLFRKTNRILRTKYIRINVKKF